MREHFSQEKRSLILAALNNAAGYPMGPKIESELGFPRAQIQPLFHRVREGQKDYILSSEEKEMINKCLEACLKYIDAWEFPAVMDHSKEDVQRFYEEFKRDVHL